MHLKSFLQSWLITIVFLSCIRICHSDSDFRKTDNLQAGRSHSDLFVDSRKTDNLQAGRSQSDLFVDFRKIDNSKQSRTSQSQTFFDESQNATPKVEYVKQTFGIGLGNPYLSLLYNPSEKVTLEVRYAGDLSDTSMYFARIYLNLNQFRRTNPWSLHSKLLDKIYLAAEYGIFYFSVTNTWDYSYSYGQHLSGYMFGIYIGYSYSLSSRFELNIDAGPAYMDLDKGFTTVIEYIINTGLRFWL